MSINRKQHAIMHKWVLKLPFTIQSVNFGILENISKEIFLEKPQAEQFFWGMPQKLKKLMKF